jgi:hypothetical protein
MEPEVITKQKITSVFNDEDVLPPIVDYINDTASLYELALEYVNRNREVFGNVMVFHSYEQLEETLDAFEEMDVNTLREWTIENNWTSNIIEANILYDSILFNQYETFGIEFDSDCDGDSNLLEATISAFDIAYELRPDYFVMRQNENGESVWDLLGTLDEYALYNDKHMFIVEGMVHISYGTEGVVICPVDLFASLDTYATDALSMYQFLIAHASQEQIPFIIYQNTSFMKNYWAKSEDGVYYLYVLFKTYERGFLNLIGLNTARVEVINKCYSSTQQGYIPYRCRVNLDLTIETKNNREKKYTFVFNKSKKCETATWKKTRLDTYYGGYLHITSFDLHLETGTGVVIDRRE